MASQIETPDIEAQDISTRTGLSVLQIMWQRKSLVVLGIMLGLVLGLLYYAQKQPTYESKAQVLIVKKSTNDDFGARSDARMVVMDDYIQTQQQIIKSPAILIKALKTPAMRDLKTFTSESEFDRIYDMQQTLLITPARDREARSGMPTPLLNLSFRGPVPEDCATILDAVIKSYQNFLDSTYKTVSDKHLELVTQARDMLNGKFETAQKEYQDFRLHSPLIVLKNSQGTTTMIAEALGKYESRRSEFRMTMQDMTDQLERVKKAYKDGGPEKGNADALQMIRAIGVKPLIFDQSNQFDKDIFGYKTKLKGMLTTYGPNHPLVKEIQEMIAELERFSGRGKNGPSTSAVLNNPDDAMSYINTMHEEVSVLQSKIETLTNLIEAEKKNARDLNVHEVTEEGLRRAVDQTQKMLEVIASQLSKIDVMKNFGGYTAEEMAKPTPARKVAPNALTVFPLAGIAGLVAGLCLAYLAELSDKSFRTPAEIRRRLGLPVIGHIPYYAPDEKAAKQVAGGEPVVDPMLCTHYQSNSVSSEAFRSVRTALYFNTHGVGHQVIQVTSPNVSDGKSTLAANLAVSIAQSGKRTIMIDGDCRRPRIHKIFNVPADTGLATVIAGQTDLAAAIRPTSIPNLSVLPCGPRPANPAELLTSPRFKELLDIIRSQYDFVIIDTPPLLVVTDPCVVAPRVDGVILAIRVTKNGRPFAERAKEILASLGANVLGVVVNGLGSPAGGKYGYGYDQYQYGYGYTYRYSYTYTDEYTDDKAASYYNTDPAGTAPPSAPLEDK